jgi:hypothetical protein
LVDSRGQADLPLRRATPGHFHEDGLRHFARHRQVGSRGRISGKWHAALRCPFLGFPSWTVLQNFTPRESGALLEMTSATMALFASLVRHERRDGDPTRILVGMSFDMSKGSGETAHRAAEHFFDGIRERRIIDSATDSSGRASFLLSTTRGRWATLWYGWRLALRPSYYISPARLEEQHLSAALKSGLSQRPHHPTSSRVGKFSFI